MIACALTAAFTAVQPSSAAGAPSLLVDPPAAQVPAGERVEISAHTADVKSCALRLNGPGGPMVRSTGAFTAPATITWSWRVPEDAVRARWAGGMSCRRGGPAATGRPPVARPLELTVLGSPGGAPRLVDGEGVQVVIETVPRRRDDPKWTEVGGFFVSLLTLLVAIPGLLYAGIQVRANYALARAERTAALAERRQVREWLDLWSRVGPGYLQAGGPVDCLTRIWAWEHAPTMTSEMKVEPEVERDRLPTLSDVIHAVNVNEETGVLFNADKIDKGQMIRHFAYELVHTFDTAWWWIHWQRENKLMARKEGSPAPNETEELAEWERMARYVADRAPDEVEPDGREDVWIFCVPADFSAEEWESHAVVSIALTRPLKQLGTLEEKVELVTDPPESCRVFCVPHWREPREVLVRTQRLAWGLNAVLESGGLSALEELA